MLELQFADYMVEKMIIKSYNKKYDFYSKRKSRKVNGKSILSKRKHQNRLS